ncbi:MAG TPA: hypothetical protein VJR06_00415 [Nitrososphaerales archaeon]|nr:hypothetical protein [Nitrososphaerales archaeon]
MDPVPGDIPNELQDDWRRLLVGEDERKMRRRLSYLQGAVAMVAKLEASMKDAFIGKKADAVDPASRSASRTLLVSSLQSHSLSIGEVLKVFTKLSEDGQGAVRRVLGWIAEHLVKILTDFGELIGLENWSVAAQLSSFPPGASFTFTLTFK